MSDQVRKCENDWSFQKTKIKHAVEKIMIINSVLGNIFKKFMNV